MACVKLLMPRTMRERSFREFDPGSGLTLAACLIHASRAPFIGSGGRLSNTLVPAPHTGISLGNEV